MLTAGRLLGGCGRTFFETALAGTFATVIPGETRFIQGSGIPASSPQDPPADLMTFGVWGSIEDAFCG
jgi:hypothetical protein